MTTEYLVQMAPMWMTAGLMTAWLAQAGWRAGAYGLLTDMALSVAGAMAGGAIAAVATGSRPGMLAMFAIGAAGATVLIAAQRRRWAHVEPRAAGATAAMTPAVRRAS
jgi:uncharacterized membrane protein YeaQ/YmgE (transglycosylase-associated protein family)